MRQSWSDRLSQALETVMANSYAGLGDEVGEREVSSGRAIRSRQTRPNVCTHLILAAPERAALSQRREGHCITFYTDFRLSTPLKHRRCLPHLVTAECPEQERL
jgi:hypothetical protein